MRLNRAKRGRNGFYPKGAGGSFLLRFIDILRHGEIVLNEETAN